MNKNYHDTKRPWDGNNNEIYVVYTGLFWSLFIYFLLDYFICIFEVILLTAPLRMRVTQKKKKRNDTDYEGIRCIWVIPCQTVRFLIKIDHDVSKVFQNVSTYSSLKNISPLFSKKKLQILFQKVICIWKSSKSWNFIRHDNL